LTLNVGKRGVSASVGPQGDKVTIGPSGVRHTVGIPGTGLFSTTKLGGRAADNDPAARPRTHIAGWLAVLIIIGVLAFFIVRFLYTGQ